MQEPTRTIPYYKGPTWDDDIAERIAAGVPRSASFKERMDHLTDLVTCLRIYSGDGEWEATQGVAIARQCKEHLELARASVLTDTDASMLHSMEPMLTYVSRKAVTPELTLAMPFGQRNISEHDAYIWAARTLEVVNPYPEPRGPRPEFPLDREGKPIKSPVPTVD